MRHDPTTVHPGGSLDEVLGPRWWVCALAPHERPVVGRGRRRRLDGDAVLRESRPAWADLLEEAANIEPASSGGGGETLAESLRPLVTAAGERLRRLTDGCLPDGFVDMPEILDAYAARLGDRLARTAASALAAAEPARTSTVRLAEQYPVLARLLAQTSLLAVEAHIELLKRYVVDRTRIVDALLDGIDPGPLVAVETGQGDTHRHGRSVSFLRFADGRRVVYKPRSLQAQVCFTALAEWLNGAAPDLGLRSVKTVVGDGYGWAEFVRNRPLAGPHEATLFYRRLGALLALLHAVRATDAHHENLIAVGDQPVLVDAETLFQPSLPLPALFPDPAAEALTESVHRTALLSSLVLTDGEVLDVSGIGGTGHTGRASANRARIADHPVEPANYEAELLEGFRLGYDTIMRGRREFRRLLTSFADIEIRIVARPTRVYAHVLAEATRAEALGDGADRDRMLRRLEYASPCPALHRLVPHELAQLWDGDVPLFVGRPDSTGVWTAQRRRIPDLFDRSGLSSALHRLDAMDEADRQDQEWIISATLAGRLPHDPHAGRRVSAGSLTVGTVPDPECLLAAACGLADRIVARSMTDQDRVNWLGLELVDDRRWLVLPMGAGLANGYCGVALFLAQLGDLTGVSRYRDVARRAVSAVPPLLESLAARPDLVEAVGCGGFHGFGGIGYALARIATLLADAEIRRAAAAAVELAAVAAGRPGPLGVARGLAGCLAAMHAVHRELDLKVAGQLAEACAERLVQLTVAPDGRMSADGEPAGFADGAAGMGWALLRYASARDDARYAKVGRALLSRIDRPPARVPGWCSGAAGLIAAQVDTDTASTAQTRELLAALTKHPVRDDHSLCHGELGIVEALILLAQRDREMVRVRQRRAGMVLDTLTRYGPHCGVPNAVPTPGLLTGLAGIGYGLMRLGFAERVPSVLLLEPTPTHHRSTTHARAVGEFGKG
ncbi:MAG TPA: type 2 lanthipeptide synthetase LanM family protein [Micromonosporaceae bacterium]